MKTRIIQNEPEEPATREAIVGAPDGLPRHSEFGGLDGPPECDSQEDGDLPAGSASPPSRVGEE